MTISQSFENYHLDTSGLTVTGLEINWFGVMIIHSGHKVVC